MSTAKPRLLLISTPVGPLGSGEGGGVEILIAQLAKSLIARGYQIDILAPQGSVLDYTTAKLIEISGRAPVSATIADPNTVIYLDPEGMVEKMWAYVEAHQQEYDLILAFSYDWLAYQMTFLLDTPVFHYVTLSAQVKVVVEELQKAYTQFPERFSFITHAQAETFKLADNHVRCISGAVDTDVIQFQLSNEAFLSWAGRISPEKGLEDAFEVASRLKMPLAICGKLQDEDYWQAILRRYPQVEVRYYGYLPLAEYLPKLAKATAFLATPHWVEAFGNTTVEALACGVPVVGYALGGVTELVEEGLSGYLVPARDVDALCHAVQKITPNMRLAARKRAEIFSLERMTDAFEQWLRCQSCAGGNSFGP